MAVPAVVDHAKRAVLEAIPSKSPFNIFNIVAIVAILLIGWFLWQKFSGKFAKGAIKMPNILPAVAVQSGQGAPLKPAEEAPPPKPEVIPEPGVKEE
jgi:hypothetical protein